MTLENKLKLVIWDLDETFWQGTLSEEGVQPIQRNIEWVRTLNRRGIVNAICSKNNTDAVKAKLEEWQLSDEFVFNKVAFAPKGEMIRDILTGMNLRAENTLFLDDRAANLEEAKFHNPGLMVGLPEQIETLFQHEHARGKDDSSLSRLKQYRQLETKWQAQTESSLTNEAFLRQSDIRIEVCDTPLTHLDRIAELVERTNQLNFTKVRLDQQQLRMQLQQPGVQAAAIRVVDRYADYGWVGFYLLADGRLEHFVFSCRILNMGVEQWLYRKLGQPTLDIAPPVSSSLQDLDVDWITEGATQAPTETPASLDGKADTTRIVIRGACNNDQIIPYLAGNFTIQKEFNFPTDNGFEVQRQSLAWLMLAMTADGSPPLDDLYRLPFFHGEALETEVPESDIVIFNPVNDFLSLFYRHRKSACLIPGPPGLGDLTDVSIFEELVNSGHPQLDEGFQRWFGDTFETQGLLSQDLLQHWLEEVDRKLATKTLVFLLPPQTDYGNAGFTALSQRFGDYNELIRSWAANRDNAHTIDFAEFVRNADDLSYGELFLYKRPVYFKVANALCQLLSHVQGETLEVRISKSQFLISRIPYLKRSLLAWSDRLINAIVRRAQLWRQP
ncbi:MAG: HAD-IIIC family phosphatase [Marinobacter sp.]|uniref:HAD-IIIC family phosphatase n=1 Tax=Marinobacter sp. TaxID=50741 RepID=UPI00299EC9C9|nr:HAD-IIIC family phosphatase [Marinobacter sp.]MDX1756596.1 HAD-IIIC family phosphatase [Marinobacter sp.]